MGAYCFFSGFDIGGGFTHDIGLRLQERIQSRKLLVFVSSNPSAHEETDYYVNVNTGWFRNIGIEFERVDILDDRKTEDECTGLIANASAIFLCGGATLLQIKFLEDYNLSPFLRGFHGAVMGVSAGAINMSVNSLYTAGKDYGKAHIYKIPKCIVLLMPV